MFDFVAIIRLSPDMEGFVSSNQFDEIPCLQSYTPELELNVLLFGEGSEFEIKAQAKDVSLLQRFEKVFDEAVSVMGLESSNVGLISLKRKSP